MRLLALGWAATLGRWMKVVARCKKLSLYCAPHGITWQMPMMLRMLSRFAPCHKATVVVRSIKEFGRGTARRSSRINAESCPCDARIYAKARRTPAPTSKPGWKRVWGVQQTTAIHTLGRMRLLTPDTLSRRFRRAQTSPPPESMRSAGASLVYSSGPPVGVWVPVCSNHFASNFDTDPMVPLRRDAMSLSSNKCYLWWGGHRQRA